MSFRGEPRRNRGIRCSILEHLSLQRRSLSWPPAVGPPLLAGAIGALSELPGTSQIRNSNSYGLAAMITAAGGVPRRLPIARDLREDLRERIATGRGDDLILLSGGVSMGQYDLVEEVLAELGAEFLFTGVHMQPGKPVVFGRLPAISASGSRPAQTERHFFGPRR